MQADPGLELVHRDRHLPFTFSLPRILQTRHELLAGVACPGQWTEAAAVLSGTVTNLEDGQGVGGVVPSFGGEGIATSADGASWIKRGRQRPVAVVPKNDDLIPRENGQS